MILCLGRYQLNNLINVQNGSQNTSQLQLAGFAKNINDWIAGISSREPSLNMMAPALEIVYW